MSNEEIYETTGFDAISERLKLLYPNQKERHYGTVVPYSLGGKDPLDGISVYKSEKGVPHWHYISYGFTELYEKESEDKEVSGWGFELTFRLKCGAEEEPPVWPMNLLQNLARYVFNSGNVFGNGHHMSCNGPIALAEETKLTALGFRIDPELGEMDTENGHMEFLQAVGITEDEMQAMMCWNGDHFMALMEQTLPYCVTDLSRNSIMEDATVKEKWSEGVERDGSSTAFLYMDEVGFETVEIAPNARAWVLRVGAGHTETLSTMLKARLRKGNELYLETKDLAIVFKHSEDKPGLGMDEPDFGVIELNEAALNELCEALQPHVGFVCLKSMPLALELVPTYIKDPEGNVIQVIE